MTSFATSVRVPTRSSTISAVFCRSLRLVAPLPAPGDSTDTAGAGPPTATAGLRSAATSEAAAGQGSVRGGLAVRAATGVLVVGVVRAGAIPAGPSRIGLPTGPARWGRSATAGCGVGDSDRRSRAARRGAPRPTTTWPEPSQRPAHRPGRLVREGGCSARHPATRSASGDGPSPPRPGSVPEASSWLTTEDALVSTAMPSTEPATRSARGGEGPAHSFLPLPYGVDHEVHHEKRHQADPERRHQPPEHDGDQHDRNAHRPVAGSAQAADPPATSPGTGRASTTSGSPRGSARWWRSRAARAGSGWPARRACPCGPGRPARASAPGTGSRPTRSAR